MIETETEPDYILFPNHTCWLKITFYFPTVPVDWKLHFVSQPYPLIGSEWGDVSYKKIVTRQILDFIVTPKSLTKKLTTPIDTSVECHCVLGSRMDFLKRFLIQVWCKCWQILSGGKLRTANQDRERVFGICHASFFNLRRFSLSSHSTLPIHSFTFVSTTTDSCPSSSLTLCPCDHNILCWLTLLSLAVLWRGMDHGWSPSCKQDHFVIIPLFLLTFRWVLLMMVCVVTIFVVMVCMVTIVTNHKFYP